MDIRVAERINIDPLLRLVAVEFERRGYEFYFIGGYVRDNFLGIPNKDVDATTNAQPETIKRILREELGNEINAMYTVGEKYGTIGLHLADIDLEITTYRTEQYEDGNRKPEVAFGSTLGEDLSRRDFTINAIACDKDANIIDPYNGLEDIKAGIVRFVGLPRDRIKEDPLRLLRAIRFASRYSFQLSLYTHTSVFVYADSIEEVSKERIRDELCKMLLHDKPSAAIRMLKEYRLLKIILGEVDRLDSVEQINPYHYENAFEHTMRVLDYSAPMLEQRLAALLHDTGKYYTIEYHNNPERTTFHGHEKDSAKFTHRVLHRLRFPHVLVNRATHLVACHMRPLQLYNELDAGRIPSRKSVRRFIKACQLDEIVQVEDVLILNKADMQGHATPNMENYYALSNIVAVVRKEGSSQPEEAKSPLDGNELMEIMDNHRPGPWIGRTKEHLTNLVVDGDIQVDDKAAAEAAARKFWAAR